MQLFDIASENSPVLEAYRRAFYRRCIEKLINAREIFNNQRLTTNYAHCMSAGLNACIDSPPIYGNLVDEIGQSRASLACLMQAHMITSANILRVARDTAEHSLAQFGTIKLEAARCFKAMDHLIDDLSKRYQPFASLIELSKCLPAVVSRWSEDDFGKVAAAHMCLKNLAGFLDQNIYQMVPYDLYYDTAKYRTLCYEVVSATIYYARRSGMDDMKIVEIIGRYSQLPRHK